jgi:hypothetical protein
MSTKDITKQHFEKDTGRSFQVYYEMLDEGDDVYLELGGFHFEATSSGGVGVNGRPSLIVHLPREWAQKIGLVDNEPKSPWPSGDTENSNGRTKIQR